MCVHLGSFTKVGGGGGEGGSSTDLCNAHNTLTAILVISVQSYCGCGWVLGEGVGTLHLLCVMHIQLYWLSVYKVMVGVGVLGEGVALQLLLVMHITAGYTGYQCTTLLWVWVGVGGGGSALHLLSVMHVITRLVINVQGNSVCLCVFRPSVGQDGFPSVCLCSVVYKVIVCVCVSDPVLAKMGSPLPVFVQ